ncbi:MAG: TetR/AcrR family transcriptional regulator [Microthrixaceae bacterium]
MSEHDEVGQPEQSIEQRLLTAALEAATIHGIAKLSMGDVARRAGLSRQTLYRYFPSKDALVAAVVSAETAALIEQVVTAAVQVEDPRASLEAALFTTLRVVRDHPLLDRLLRTEPEALLPLLTAEGSPAMTQVRTIVEALVAERRPPVADDPVALRRFADVLTRLLISYAISAPDDPPEVVAQYLSMFLIPDVVSGVDAPEALR